LIAHREAAAQDRVAPTTFFSEVLTNTGAFSVNVDHIFYQPGLVKFSVRGGFTGIRGAVTVPVGLNALGKIGNASYLEVGATYTPVLFSWRNALNDLRDGFNGRLGYRHQNPKGGFFWNVAAFYHFRLPFLNDTNANRVGLGVGIGYTLDW
jgi:hypothetical protein